MDLNAVYKKVLGLKEEDAASAPNPQQKKMPKRRTKILINPPLNELSKTILSKYIKKAKNDIGNKSFVAGVNSTKKGNEAKALTVALINKAQDRSKQVNKAVNKISEGLVADTSSAVNDPYGALANPKMGFFLKNLAFQVINKRTESVEQIEENYDHLLEYKEEYDEIMEEIEEINEVKKVAAGKKPKVTLGVKAADSVAKKKKKPNTAAKMQEGRDWHKNHPVDHMNIVNAYNDSNPEEKAFGKNWYSDAHKLTKFLSKGSGHSMSTVAGVIANHSPQNGIYQNYHDAVQVLDKGQGIGGKGQGMMASEKQKAVDDKMFAGEHYDTALKGKKVKSFAHLLEHGRQTDPSRPRVVIDRHAHSVASGARITDNAFGMAGLKNKGVYENIEHHYLKAAEHLRVKHGVNIEPEQLQATTWAWRQRKNQEAEQAGPIAGEKKKRGGGGSAKKSMHQQRSWNDFAKTRFAGQKLPKVPGHGFKEEKPESEFAGEEPQPYHHNTKWKLHAAKLLKAEGPSDTWTHQF